MISLNHACIKTGKRHTYHYEERQGRYYCVKIEPPANASVRGFLTAKTEKRRDPVNVRGEDIENPTCTGCGADEWVMCQCGTFVCTRDRVLFKCICGRSGRTGTLVSLDAAQSGNSVKALGGPGLLRIK